MVKGDEDMGKKALGEVAVEQMNHSEIIHSIAEAMNVIEGVKNDLTKKDGQSDEYEEKMAGLDKISKALYTVANSYLPCWECRGRGFKLVAIKPVSNYNTIVMNGGKVLYKVECKDCEGRGQVDYRVCRSCSISFSVMVPRIFPAYIEEEYCEDCLKIYRDKLGVSEKSKSFFPCFSKEDELDKSHVTLHKVEDSPKEDKADTKKKKKDKKKRGS